MKARGGEGSASDEPPREPRQRPEGAERIAMLIATTNRHKLEEIAAILGRGFDLVAHDPGVEETGTTFEENALLKARAAARSTGRTAIADDSGIVIDALEGRPGVASARWTDEDDWIPRVLRELAAVPDRPRSARYVAVAAVCFPDGRCETMTGTVEGVIAAEPRGSAGFGYDPIFVPVESDGRTFAEMSAPEKHALSHRGRAFRALREMLSDEAD